MPSDTYNFSLQRPQDSQHVIESLNRAGHLQAIYMALASVANFRDLIERLNRRLASAA